MLIDLRHGKFEYGWIDEVKVKLYEKKAQDHDQRKKLVNVTVGECRLLEWVITRSKLYFAVRRSRDMLKQIYD